MPAINAEPSPPILFKPQMLRARREEKETSKAERPKVMEKPLTARPKVPQPQVVVGYRPKGANPRVLQPPMQPKESLRMLKVAVEANQKVVVKVAKERDRGPRLVPTLEMQTSIMIPTTRQLLRSRPRAFGLEMYLWF